MSESAVRELDADERMTEKVSPNSATYWLPKLLSSDLLLPYVPTTECVPYSHYELVGALEGAGGYKDFSRIVVQVAEIADCIGYPVFIRTDLASAKHNGPKHYKVERRSDINRVLCRTAEDNEIKLWHNRESPQCFMVRRFLELEAPFVAFGGLPISRDWRLFATPSEILCAHPYWPEDVLHFSDEPRPDWRERLADLHEQPKAEEWDALCHAARAAASLCTDAPAWSVDFAKDTSGKWWLIDMAVASDSWHWPTCARVAASEADRTAKGEG